MNNLGGMVFIVAGIALGYWALTGKAVNFLHAINFGSPGSTNPAVPQPQLPTSPGCPAGQSRLWPGGPCVSGMGGQGSFVNDITQGVAPYTNISPGLQQLDPNLIAYLNQDLQGEFIPGVPQNFPGSNYIL